MDSEEAQAWLRGERSTTNWLQQPDNKQSHVQVHQADAALTEQAYWVVRAHKEGLVEAPDGQ